jgi:DNA-binding NtrC family response regulator
MTNRDYHENGKVAAVISGLLLGASPPMQRLRALIARLATSDAPVLIEGPTGSGKELVAEALHLSSGRTGAFVAFNVCAISDGTFESAVFGHVRGAFTGALDDVPGYLSEADGGTVFFDEISSLPLPTQAKLLRAIETRSFRPVGARRDRASDFRLIAATNDDLAVLVRQGRFRPDLFHRLRGLVIPVPPLADHAEDVPLLARHFARASGNHEVTELSGGAMDRLMDHQWPGNVRELRNVVEFAVRLADGGVVSAAEVSQALGGAGSGASRDERGCMRQQLLTLLVDCDGDIARVSELLGLHSSNVYRRMQRLGITPPKRRHVPADPGADVRPPAAATS